MKIDFRATTSLTEQEQNQFGLPRHWSLSCLPTIFGLFAFSCLIDFPVAHSPSITPFFVSLSFFLLIFCFPA